MSSITPQTILIVVTLVTAASTGLVLFLNSIKFKRDIGKSQFKNLSVQLLALIVWLVILVELLLPNKDSDPILSLVIFLVSVVLGIFLVINVAREIKIQSTLDELIQKLQEDNERLKRLDEQKSEFVSLASHQLRGPLSIIQGYSSMISDGDYGKIPKNLSEPIERIFQSSSALGFLINDYLDMSKIEKGEMEYIIENVNVSEMLDNLVKEFAPIAKAAKIALKLDLKNDKNYYIRADRIKLKQIISNIIDNAIKYTPKGAVTLLCERKGDMVVIKIQDTGVGFDEKDSEEIFKKFKRSKSAINVNVSGTGIGLFVAKVMTEAQNGEIAAKSDGVGKGSTFTLKFPIIK